MSSMIVSRSLLAPSRGPLVAFLSPVDYYSLHRVCGVCVCLRYINGKLVSKTQTQRALFYGFLFIHDIYFCI